ncbi:AMP-binding protein [Mycobacterium haemophilum]|uniref:Acyl-CoA synthetase n=1 Tax=Mycobacterium haemophilum TaxID=29311 RepID=A0A0I9ZRJ2_9MYCO|nr:AMP-binding protein [Mycobacterium haemophilum]KLO32789.1 acyl-CoA synthetase [Mycobacterium haemophilum]KLO37091.1 acyl-CoA synthetase [Mycobacterium haemophilum]KLO43564.1 acyl-CoA synthetase [Mycobacterium haemophilum]KLO55922.1 acyl-CoA synthetase [Mycobacterium haemophilum]
MVEPSIPGVLRERASLAPNDTALTFIDYEQDWDGVAASLTWSQLYRRMLNVAEVLRISGSPGDRVVILAPQGLDYIVGLLGAFQAGLIAVPLSVPHGGAHDERAISVLGDTSPAVILTTSAVADQVAPYAQPRPDQPAASIVEVDVLDLDSQLRSSSRPGARAAGVDWPSTLYLQYTSGSTRTPAGVMVSNKNLFTNFEQIMAGYYGTHGNVPPPDTTFVSWLPFYHDMGFIVGIMLPILAGAHAVLTSPAGFLQRPSRWMQLLANNSRVYSAAPNFAFEVAARKTSDDEMAGLDLGDVHCILNGSERVQPVTLKRFVDRFAAYNLDPTVLRPSYGMAEATVFVATREAWTPPEVVHFESDELAAGNAKRCASGSGTPLVSYGVATSPLVRVVDPDTAVECPAETVGEIWVHGRNVATGYWQKPEESVCKFSATIVNPSAGTPEGPWLKTGDSGFFSEGDLFIIGRIKDLLIVYGRNHSPDDIEATIQEVTPGRCAAIAVPDHGVEKLVAIIELKKRNGSDEDATSLRVVKREVTSAISKSHGLRVADLVLVSPGAIPITTSGKVRRAQCVELYQHDEFTRLDV